MPVQQQWIQQAYVFALDATPRQERRFWAHAGAARFCYNWGLDTFAAYLDQYAAEKAAGVEKPQTQLPGHFALCKLWVIHKDTYAETPDERGRVLGWVGEQFSGTYQAALRDAHMAWSNFFKSRAGKRAGRRMGRPKFKSRHKAKPSFQMHGEGLQISDAHHIKLPKIGLVKTHESTRKLLRRLNKITVCTGCTGTGAIPDPKKDDGSQITCKMCKGNQKLPVARIVRGTISRTSRGRWQISITAEVLREIRTGPSARQRAGGTIGIDLGVRDIITTSSGMVFTAPQHLEHAQAKLRKLGRALSRCAKDSKRRTKARARLARAHGRVADLRADNLKKVTTALIHSHEHLIVEGWNAQALAEHGSAHLPKHIRRRRNRNLADASPGNTRWYLSSKAVWYGATVTITETHEATSRTCSGCGQVRTKPVPQDQEQFTCAGCGLTVSRRINTARLLAKTGRAKQVAPSGGETLNARGGDVRPETPRRSGQSPMKREARRQPQAGSKTGTPDP